MNQGTKVNMFQSFAFLFIKLYLKKNCFYSDIKHKSNNTTKHAQKVTSVVEFQAQKILAKIIQNNRLIKMTFKALKMVKV